MNAVLWLRKLCRDVRERHLAVEGNQLWDLKIDDNLQCREIMLDLDSSSISFFFLPKRSLTSYRIGVCCNAVGWSKRQVSNGLSSINQ